MKMPKPCIFCGSLGDKSKEHFYPAWLSDIIPPQPIDNVSTLVTRLGNGPKEIIERSRRQGHLITKKLRVVCRACNNGWMSRLESTVKPFLVAGLTGKDQTLESADLAEIARWTCLKSMLAEHSDPTLASTPAIDRAAFFSGSVIPNYFRIYLGAQSTPSITWLYRHSATISFSSTVNPPLLDGLQRNVQTTTFILGRLVFHVLAARVDAFDADREISYPGLAKIWPLPAAALRISELRVLNGEQLRIVRESFEAYLAHQKPRFVADVI
jgi:hypothetical protein